MHNDDAAHGRFVFTAEGLIASQAVQKLFQHQNRGMRMSGTARSPVEIHCRRPPVAIVREAQNEGRAKIGLADVSPGLADFSRRTL